MKEAAKIPRVSLFSGVGGLEAGASPSDPHWGSIFSHSGYGSNRIASIHWPFH